MDDIIYISSGEEEEDAPPEAYVEDAEESDAEFTPNGRGHNGHRNPRQGHPFFEQ